MANGLPKRYVSEKAVKRALKIDSFRSLSKDKIIEFASMIPYMDREVATAIINQFPKFAEFGKIAISRYMELCNNILEKNKESQSAAIRAYQTILDSLAQRMTVETITEEESLQIKSQGSKRKNPPFGGGSQQQGISGLKKYLSKMGLQLSTKP